MNMNRFNFYLYIIINKYNKIKCDGKFSVIYIPVNFVSNRRKINEISTDKEDVSSSFIMVFFNKRFTFIFPKKSKKS